MKVIKANLKPGEKKRFVQRIGKKVKLINKQDYLEKKRKEELKKANKNNK
jgi:hypothetical protein